MQKDIPSEEIKTGEEDDDDNGDNLLKDSNDSEFELLLILRSYLPFIQPISTLYFFFHINLFSTPRLIHLAEE